jgi:uncharacterized glyoxalase superfamily protein PhnB
MTIKPIPAGYHTVTPYISVMGAPKLIDFLKQAFGATEVSRHAMPDGRILNAVLRIGDSILWLADSPPERPPKLAQFYLYVGDTDATNNSAVAAGGDSVEKPSDTFYGDRRAGVADLFGNTWWIATRVKEPTPEDIKRGEEARA